MGRTKTTPTQIVNVLPLDLPEIEQHDPEPSQFVQVAVGPNRTISIKVKKASPKKSKSKRKEEVPKEQIRVDPLPPEVDILLQGLFTEIHIKPRASATTNTDRWSLLQRIYLEQTILLISDNGNDEPYVIQSADGALILLSLTTLGKMDAIGHAIHDGTMQLECHAESGTQIVTLSLFLTSKALDVCSPKILVYGCLSKKTIAKKCVPAKHLHQALAYLFPTLAQHASTADTITAKMVYDVVDNVQITNHECRRQEETTPTMTDIPGLVPKLRPYQQAAVMWMLEREHQQHDNSNSNEWELAWFALLQQHSPTATTATTTLVPLHELNEYSRQNDDVQLLISPFSGWITATCNQARIATLGHSPPNVNGGILADSMGTGKTVEVIACILAHQYENEKVQDSLLPFNEEMRSTQTPLLPIQFETKPQSQCDDFDDDVSSSDEKLPDNTLMTVEHLGACMCGNKNLFREALSMVLCRSCEEPMHGICAGFTTIDELVQQTSLEWRSDYVKARFAVRLCSERCCPTCVFSSRDKGLLASRATLIVTPPSIINQWEREIRRHTAITPDWTTESQTISPTLPNKRPLKVVVYPGIRELYRKKPGNMDDSLGYPICHLIHADKLGDADVVLMTFDALMGDLGHTDENPFTDNSVQGLRMRKRYRVTPSPLTSIHWWRICLDEAQRIEVPTATSARMALKLEAHFRWCVSGTPIGRGKLDDLYGLILFLRMYPFAGKQWFDKCFQAGHIGVMGRVQVMLKNVMWRSTTAHPSVRRQMGVPEQVEKKVLLTFSSIEKHFYDRQLEKTMVAASEVLGMTCRGPTKGKADFLAAQLHRLRAACCHPQVGSNGIGRVGKTRKHTGDNGVSVGAGVLTMDQILDRLIDDAKVHCEEAQRIAILHTNAMAALSRLKVEAKSMGDVSFTDNDASLLAQSCKSYMESLEIAEANAKPTTLVGEATVTGCQGFLSRRNVVRDGKATLLWKIKLQRGELTNIRNLWARFDFEGPSKKITEAQVRVLTSIPVEFEQELGSDHVFLYPQNATLQVAHSSLGGEFVDVIDFDLSSNATNDEGWLSQAGLRTNKSKGWRLLLTDYDVVDKNSLPVALDDVVTFVVAVDIQMLEAHVASDSLQRLHVLHNLSLSMSALQQLGLDGSSLNISKAEMKEKMNNMHSESRRIESLYMDAARAPHVESQRDLKHYSGERAKVEHDFFALGYRLRTHEITDLWQDLWWDDLLATCYLHGGPQDRERLCDVMHVALDDFVTDTVEGQKFRSRPIDQQRYKGFPNFQDVDGLQRGLGFRLEEYVSILDGKNHTKTIEDVLSLSAQPSDMEIYENSHCGKCREDWNQTGPTCRHCHLETGLRKLLPDNLILCILKTLWKWLKDTKFSGKISSAIKEAMISERASKFFELVKANETERQKALKVWTTHFDLLSDIDELNQCKRSMRLAQLGEDLTKLTEDELNAIVAPWDINSRLLDHSTKQAMALANLRRNTHTLRYLRNQSVERQAEEERKKNGTKSDNNENTCIVCLSEFDGERAVLACGHSFHQSPCMERLMGSSNSVIACPLRCVKRTKRDEIMIATDKPKDDGSKGTRTVQGSWGTKVTRLLGDLMDVTDQGDKCIVFSQWEDMLDVVEHALVANGVSHARVKSMSRLGDTIKKFRSNECFVLLLNVKNGAEGLTLVEANHVFMIEPLLNCGLDSQAIARVNRIGQTSMTCVHRYLIEGTIEIRIDSIRVERQEDQLEDSISEAKKKHDVSAGGIDGGFSASELQAVLS